MSNYPTFKYYVPAAHDVLGKLLPPAEYTIHSSFSVDPSDPDSPPYVLGLWVETQEQTVPSPTGKNIIPIYLTQAQVDEAVEANKPGARSEA
jgi:hypothetical protein